MGLGCAASPDSDEQICPLDCVPYTIAQGGGMGKICERSHTILLLHTVHGFRRHDRSDHLELFEFDHEGNPGESLPLVESSLRNGRSRTIDPLDDDVVLSWVDTRHAIGLARVMSPLEAPRDWLVPSHR